MLYDLAIGGGSVPLQNEVWLHDLLVPHATASYDRQLMKMLRQQCGDKYSGLSSFFGRVGYVRDLRGGLEMQ